ncbi:MAG: twin transmembrane helix small protein [Burkholderiales bacterium]|jgi:NADH:ubiquinone oxidoreductase subunit 6 (subunit J)|nr:twin transmembrane helix small protein [Burkholderiales bacterium]
MKVLIAVALIGIVIVLALAGVFMLRDGRDGQPKTGSMMRALALRVTLSILLLAFILLSYWMGWIKPTGIALG